MFNYLEKAMMTRLTVFFALALVLLTPDAVFAAYNASGLNSTVGAGLCAVVSAITGNVGKALATLAIIVLGISAFFGKVTWGLAIMFGTGIIGIFGAGTLIGVFGGGTGCGAAAPAPAGP
jgi:type IV secretory pathway VirB2 component (pilin)